MTTDQDRAMQALMAEGGWTRCEVMPLGPCVRLWLTEGDVAGRRIVTLNPEGEEVKSYVEELAKAHGL